MNADEKAEYATELAKLLKTREAADERQREQIDNAIAKMRDLVHQKSTNPVAAWDLIERGGKRLAALGAERIVGERVRVAVRADERHALILAVDVLRLPAAPVAAWLV